MPTEGEKFKIKILRSDSYVDKINKDKVIMFVKGYVNDKIQFKMGIVTLNEVEDFNAAAAKILVAGNDVPLSTINSLNKLEP